MSLYMVTLAELKENLGLKDTVDDAALMRWCLGLQDRFEKLCERDFLRVENREEIFNGNERYLFTRLFPVESVAGIWISARQLWDDTTKLAAGQACIAQGRGQIAYVPTPPFTPTMATDYYMAWGLPQMVADIKWPMGFQNIRVVYTGGYVAAGTTPATGQFAMDESLRRAFFMQAEFEWRNRQNLGKSSVGAGGVSISLAPAKLLPEVEETLQPLRRIL